eukprot:642876-Ditylum_brightwellii.AAC.1
MDPNMQVKLQDAKEGVMTLASTIGSKYLLLEEEQVFGARDGLKFYLEKSGYHLIQMLFIMARSMITM